MHIAINPRLLLIRHRLGQCRGLATVTQIQASIEPQAGIPGVYTLTLNRPEAKNSLGRQLMTQLREALRGLKLDQAKCLLIQSNVAGTFCAGADLKVAYYKYLKLSATLQPCTFGPSHHVD